MQSQILGEFRIFIAATHSLFFLIPDLLPIIPDPSYYLHPKSQPPHSSATSQCDSRPNYTDMAYNFRNKSTFYFYFQSLTIFSYLYRFAFKVAVLANIARP